MDVRDSRHSRRSDPPMDPSQFYFPKPCPKSRRDVIQTRRTPKFRQAHEETELFNTSVRTKKLSTNRSSSCSPPRVERRQYDQVRGELEVVKRELSKLKLGMASILGEKARAQSQSTSAKEASNIQAFGHEESGEFSFSMEETNEKMEQLRREKWIDTDQSKELQHELAVTLADVSSLQNELKVAKEMDKRGASSDSPKQREDNLELAVVVRSETSHLLASVTQELEAAQKELDSVREEGSQFMSSMDIIRNELKRVTEEISRLEKSEGKADVKAKGLNSKLLRAKSKLEAASAAEAKAKWTLTNLSLSVEQLQTEAQASKKEKALISEETEVIKAETLKTESEINASEEKLLTAMEALEDVKSSEASSLDKLNSLIETSIRVFNFQKDPTTTISKFEYEYLTGRAVEAEEIADKKVAAAQAWIEAFKASEKEVVMKTEIAQRDLREIRMEEEREAVRSQGRLSANTREEREPRNLGKKQEKGNDEEQNPYSNYSRKYVKYRGKSSPYGRGQAKRHKSASPASLRCTPVISKKNQKVMPKLGKFFGGKKSSKDV